MKKDFKAIREQGNKFVTEDIIHVITRTNRAECGAVCPNDRLSAGHIWQTRSHVYGEVKCQAEIQSDVVIPNKLGNGETCQGLRHWRLLSNLKNNFLKPVRNDMDNKNRLDCFAFARNDEIVGFEDNKILNQVQNDNTAVVQNNAKDKTVTNLFPYFPIFLSLKNKTEMNLSTYRLIDFTKKKLLRNLRSSLEFFTIPRVKG